jgi:outer membrane protein TolC
MREKVVVLLLLTATVAARTALPAQSPAPVRLSFAEAVARATGAAPAVELAGWRTDEARARVRQARAYILPSLSAGAGWVNRSLNRRSFGIEFPTTPGSPPSSDLVGPFDNADARLRVSQTVFDWSGRGRLVAARAQLESAEADGGAAAEAAAQGAALAYLRMLRGRALVAARAADSALAAELVSLARAQRDAGVSAGIDLTRAQTQLTAAAGALVVARNQEQRAKIDLGRVLGLDPATPLDPSDTLAAALPRVDVPAERGAAVALGVARRADLAAEIARGTAARRMAAAIRAERLPRLDIAADYGANGPSFGDAIATRQVAVQVTLPILDGFRREGRLAENDALARGAETRVRDLRQQIAADVDAARLDVSSGAALEAIAAQALTLARQEVAEARERFAAGVAGNIELITAQQSLLHARDADIDARFAAAAARVALARAAGVARTLR